MFVQGMSIERVWILHETCVGFARKVNLFMFKSERKEYKCRTDCTIAAKPEFSDV